MMLLPAAIFISMSRCSHTQEPVYLLFDGIALLILQWNRGGRRCLFCFNKTQCKLLCGALKRAEPLIQSLHRGLKFTAECGDKILCNPELTQLKQQI